MVGGVWLGFFYFFFLILVQGKEDVTPLSNQTQQFSLNPKLAYFSFEIDSLHHAALSINIRDLRGRGDVNATDTIRFYVKKSEKPQEDSYDLFRDYVYRGNYDYFTLNLNELGKWFIGVKSLRTEGILTAYLTLQLRGASPLSFNDTTKVSHSQSEDLWDCFSFSSAKLFQIYMDSGSTIYKLIFQKDSLPVVKRKNEDFLIGKKILTPFLTGDIYLCLSPLESSYFDYSIAAHEVKKINANLQTNFSSEIGSGKVFEIGLAENLALMTVHHLWTKTNTALDYITREFSNENFTEHAVNVSKQYRLPTVPGAWYLNVLCKQYYRCSVNYSLSFHEPEEIERDQVYPVTFTPEKTWVDYTVTIPQGARNLWLSIERYGFAVGSTPLVLLRHNQFAYENKYDYIIGRSQTTLKSINIRSPAAGKWYLSLINNSFSIANVNLFVRSQVGIIEMKGGEKYLSQLRVGEWKDYTFTVPSSLSKFQVELSLSSLEYAVVLVVKKGSFADDLNDPRLLVKEYSELVTKVVDIDPVVKGEVYYISVYSPQGVAAYSLGVLSHDDENSSSGGGETVLYGLLIFLVVLVLLVLLLQGFFLSRVNRTHFPLFSSKEDMEDVEMKFLQK